MQANYTVVAVGKGRNYCVICHLLENWDASRSMFALPPLGVSWLENIGGGNIILGSFVGVVVVV